jgi:hypothetical protein
VLTLAPVTTAFAATPNTVQSPSTAATCNSSDARQLVDSFVDSFNRGDAKQLDQLVAGPERFIWYSTDSPGQRIGEEAYQRSTLMSYFAARHDQHERLQLRSFRFNGIYGMGLGGFEFELTRGAADGVASTPYVGKGAIDCHSAPHTLVVWSMARESPLRSKLPSYLLPVALFVAALAASVFVLLRRRRRYLRRSSYQ